MAAPLSPTSTPVSSHDTLRKSILSPRSSHFIFPSKPISFIPRASSDSDPEPEITPQQPTSDDDPFESRLAQVRLRYRSGTGKKAEERKMKKGKKDSMASTKAGGGGGVFLPPVPLKEPTSGGLKVEFGFSPYSERVNGRLAGLGLAALLLVELATGKSVMNYHTPSIIFIQVYFMAAACALFLKFEKEKVSVWPQGDATSSGNNSS